MQHASRSLLGLTLWISALGTHAYADQWNGRWSQQFGWPLIPIHATLLPNGKVFTFGTNGSGQQGAYQYDIWTPGWAGGGAHQTLWHNQNTDIFCSATGLMPNGDVLIPGGDTRNPINVGIKDTLVLQSWSSNMVRAPYMNQARWYPTLTTLPNGESLIHGGREGDGQPIAAPEIYNNGWRTLWGAANNAITGNAEAKWFYPRNFVAPNGRVFGMSGNQMYFLDWGADGGTQLAGLLPNKTRSHTSTAVMYQPGKIFQAGGSVAGDTQAEGSRQAISVDVTSGWPRVDHLPDMAFRRVWANSTVLPNGEVLITGGSAFENKNIDAARTAEIWNPNTRQFRRAATAATPRLYHSVALLLPDATVLVGGGGAPGPFTNLNGEIFYPPYLFQGGAFAERLTLGNFATNQRYNNVVNVPFSGAGGVSRVTLVRTGAVTHSFDMSQRFIELGFSRQGNSVNVVMPGSPNLAPPGYYMLFLLNDQGVPSVAKIISLNQWNPATNNPGGGPQAGSTYQIVARFSDKCVDVDKGDPANGTNVLQWSCAGTANQKFRVQAAANGAFNLVNTQTGKCVDVSGPSSDNGANIHQWECHGGSNQAVRFVPGTNGSYQIRFDHSGKCLDVEGPNPNDGANVHQWECLAGAGNQEFFFRP